MLSSINIRRLISQKKHGGGVEVDDDPFYLQDDIDHVRTSYRDGRVRSWKPPMMRRPGSKSNFDIPRSEDIHRISLIPPFPDTPHSSRSSLCSCENGTSHGSPRSSPPLRPRNVEHWQHTRQHSRGSSPSPRGIPGAPHSPPPTPQPSQHRTSPEILESDFSDVTPLAIEIEDCGKEGGLAITYNESTEQIIQEEDNIQQLIRETEAAFKLQDAFVEAKFASPVLEEDRQAVRTPDPASIPSTPSRPTRAKSQRLSQSSLKSPTKPHVKALILPNPARFAPVSKTKRTRSKKARRKSRAISSQPSRWGLTETAKDLFTIRIFSRIEADEMLPESTLQEIRMSRASQSQWAKYNESVVTDGETDGISTRTESPNGSPSLLSEQADTPRSSESNSEELDRDSSATPKPEPQQQEPIQQTNHNGQATAKIDIDDDEDTLPIMMIMDEQPTKTLTSSTPPPKRGSPRRLPSRQLPPLPTIPEVTATGPENAVLCSTSIPPAPGSTAKINTDDYVFLDSTRCTLTMPTFHHGSIRLAKADLRPVAVDDTLDWTAFQMAILGGAGDFFSESTDYSRPSETELDDLDDMVSWYTSLGLGRAGGLITEADCPTPPSSGDRRTSVSSQKNSRTARSGGKRRSPRSNPASQGQRQQQQQQQRRSSQDRRGSEAPIPVIVEPATSPTPTTTPKPQEPPAGAARQKLSDLTPKDLGFQPLMAESHPTRFLFANSMIGSRNGGNGNDNASVPRSTLNHIGLAIDSARRPSVDSVQSLPQSPMLDLVVSRDVEGNEYVVPMGFNLGHDLGDFLKWEAENVFAAGYGADQG